MNKKTLTITALVVVAVIAAFLIGRGFSEGPLTSATPGGNAIEQYVPGVLYNGGIYSTLPIQTTSDITGVGITGTTLTVGSGGSSISEIIKGTCNASTTGLPLVATSSSQFYCTVTGATSGDIVLVSLPRGAASTTVGAGGFSVYATGATTNTIYFSLFNLSGAATSSFRLATTSVQYTIIR